jgi:hypothetical protein
MMSRYASTLLRFHTCDVLDGKTGKGHAMSSKAVTTVALGFAGAFVISTASPSWAAPVLSIAAAVKTTAPNGPSRVGWRGWGGGYDYPGDYSYGAGAYSDYCPPASSYGSYSYPSYDPGYSSYYYAPRAYYRPYAYGGARPYGYYRGYGRW